jgi:hypothetical protein
MSNLRKDVATREALLHEVANQVKDVEDQIASLLQRVRQRFDRAGVPMQDVQIRFRGLSVTGMAAVKSLKPLPSSLLVEAVRVSGCWGGHRWLMEGAACSGSCSTPFAGTFLPGALLSLQSAREAAGGKPNRRLKKARCCRWFPLAHAAAAAASPPDAGMALLRTALVRPHRTLRRCTSSKTFPPCCAPDASRCCWGPRERARRY